MFSRRWECLTMVNLTTFLKKKNGAVRFLNFKLYAEPRDPTKIFFSREETHWVKSLCYTPIYYELYMYYILRVAPGLSQTRTWTRSVFPWSGFAGSGLIKGGFGNTFLGSYNPMFEKFKILGLAPIDVLIGCGSKRSPTGSKLKPIN